MKPDSGTTDRADPVYRASPIGRAHLADPADTTHTLARLPAPPDLADLVRWFWIPRWSVPPGEESVQAVLRYPVCLVVVTPTYSRFYGVEAGLSRTTLAGTGWAFGLALQPAAGALLTGDPVSRWQDRAADLPDLLGEAGAAFTERIRVVLNPDPDDGDAHLAGVGATRALLHPHLPVDDDGRLANAVVEWIESTPQVMRVAQVAERFGLTERALQRLCQRRIGLGAKWIIQRRRLHEAVELLRAEAADRGPGALADVAASLGYADQAHFTRDFRAVTGMTPGQFLRRERGADLGRVRD